MKAVAFAAGLGLGMLSYPVHAAPTSSGDTVQGLLSNNVPKRIHNGGWLNGGARPSGGTRNQPRPEILPIFI
jgi:hypothetical protein